MKINVKITDLTTGKELRTIWKVPARYLKREKKKA